MSQSYPVTLDITGRRCVVVGGGSVAARKAASLADAGADTVVVAPKACDEVKRMADENRIAYVAEPFAPHHLDDAFLVFAATDDREVNRSVYREATLRRAPVNVADQPELCGFYVPSVLRRGDLTIAVSTNGASPAVARRVRTRLEKEFGDEWIAYLDLMAEARKLTLRTVHDAAARREIFSRLADAGLLETIAAGDVAAARATMTEIVGG